MEVTKVSPAPVDPAANRIGTGAGAGPGAPSAGLPATAGGAVTDSDPVALLTDLVNIHPLDVAGALQILIAELSAALGAGAPVPVRANYTSLPGALSAPDPATAPLTLVDMVLQRVSREDIQQPADWLVMAAQVEAATRLGLDKAVDAVLAWRNVPLLVVEAAKGTREVVLATFDDDPPNPVWLRPEWLGLAPRIERFWRRRRQARRRVSDPDLQAQPWYLDERSPDGQR